MDWISSLFPGGMMPGMDPTTSWAVPTPGLGELADPTAGAPMDITSQAQKQGLQQDGGPQIDMAKAGKALTDTLKGAVAPKPPDVVKPSTPAVPQMRPIQASGIFDQMAAMGITPQQALSARMPQTLLGAIGGR